MVNHNASLLSRQRYWDRRYSSESMIWGKEWVFGDAIETFRSRRIDKILVLGCGYGRSNLCLASAGIRTVGIDFSRKVMRIGKNLAQESRFVQYILGCVCTVPFCKDSFDGILAYNILHLLLEDERFVLMKEINRVVRKGGIVVAVALSVHDSTFGLGSEIEKNTFDLEKRGPRHFFAEEEMAGFFNGFEMERLDSIQICEDHGGRHHSHVAVRAVARKTGHFADGSDSAITSNEAHVLGDVK